MTTVRVLATKTILNTRVVRLKHVHVMMTVVADAIKKRLPRLGLERPFLGIVHRIIEGVTRVVVAKHILYLG